MAEPTPAMPVAWRIELAHTDGTESVAYVHPDDFPDIVAGDEFFGATVISVEKPRA